eukprot:CAMPEP_0171093576 /NCGR_PEP_ID=MMETSP0766_2-20121228/39158_1 /TAXON_ID=439317 /ORGANISM="Gambierdiscus australes, Strain CAWD 149" /LENGTH=181 /DNA_ID=CAMNT_0011552041 /DNA_START=189 /DNA_END=734 /DNA_ORIENTATION=-
MGQLFYILGHIQKLSAQAPVTAQALLAENPQICFALLHAESLAGMMEEPELPMTSEELKKAKLKARQMQEDLAVHELPPPATGQAQVPPLAHAALSPVFAKSQALRLHPGVVPGGPAHSPRVAVAAPKVHGALSSADAGTEDQKQNLLNKVMQLTPEQIGRLPEGTKVQLLTFLQQQSQQT